MSAEPLSEREYNRMRCRAYHLPKQLARARLRVRHLETEAVRLGMAELVAGQ